MSRTGTITQAVLKLVISAGLETAHKSPDLSLFRVKRAWKDGQCALDTTACSDEALPPLDLNDWEHGKDHLSAETDRSSRRSVRGKLIHERSTEYGTESDFSRHQHQERDEAHQ